MVNEILSDILKIYFYINYIHIEITHSNLTHTEANEMYKIKV